MDAKNNKVTHYTKAGKIGTNLAGFTGELHVWGFDCVPDVFKVVDGNIVETVFSARGDWTKVS